MNSPSTQPEASGIRRFSLIALAAGAISVLSGGVDDLATKLEKGERFAETGKSQNVNTTPRCTVDAAGVRGEQRSKLIAAAARMGCVVKSEQEPEQTTAEK